MSELGIGAALTRLPAAVTLTLLVALPSYFNLATDQIFEEEKSLLLRAGALVALPSLAVLWHGGMRSVLRHPIVMFAAGLLAALAAATAFALVPHDALMGAHLRRHGLVLWISLAIVFAALMDVMRAPAGRQLIVRAIVIGAAWPSLYLLLQRAGLDPWHWIAPSEGFKAGGTFGNHVMVGGYLAMVIPLTALEAWRSSRLWAVLLLLQVAALIASGSRGAMLALAAGTAAAGITLLWKYAPRRTSIAVVAGAVIVAGAVAAVPALRPRLIATQFDPAVGSARVRMLIWNNTAAIVAGSGARIFIGYGPESLASLFSSHYSPEIGYWEQTDAMPDRAHNETLDMLVWAGAAGMAMELGLFVTVLAGAWRVANPSVRAALTAAAVAHVVEIQFGIASAAGRLGFLAVTSVVLGLQLPSHEQRFGRTASWWLVAGAIVAAVSPWLSIIPSLADNPPASGGEAAFVAYLRHLSSAIPFVFGAFLIAALGLARSLGGAGSGTAWRAILLAAGIWAALAIGVAPSRADALTAAGRAYERQQRWAEATVAYRAAAAAQPRVAAYHSNAGRTAAEWAVRSEAPRRDVLLEEARQRFQRAVDLNPLDVEARRRLAAHPRILASLVQGAEREELLRRADRAYAEVSALAPTSPAVWVEWAWVDADRGHVDAAIRKVELALDLNRRHRPALALQALLAQR
ncbi:MAG TPA: O-antigen ligase family protein [Vicinamibacterales bacterium]